MMDAIFPLQKLKTAKTASHFEKSFYIRNMARKTALETKRGEIKRELGIVSATSLVVANMIGAGIFTTSGIIAGYLPSAGWVLFCWFFGGLVAMAGALSYAELATRMPEVGGEYVYLKRLYHPALGFLTGWTSFFVGFSAPIATSALGFSEYLFAGLSAPAAESLLLKKSIAVSLILMFTLTHYLGLRVGAAVQNVLTAFKVLIVIGLAGTGMVLGGGHLSMPRSTGHPGHDLLSVGTALMIVGFAYSGWNASAYMAGEVRNPRKTLPVSLVGGTALVMILYLAVNLFILKSLPFEEIRGVIPIVEKASVQTFGPWMGRVLSFLVSIMLLSSLSAFILLGPRVYFAMARDGLFFHFAAHVHPRFHVPGRSILLQGALAGLMVLLGTFEQLVMYIVFALSIFPWLAVLGVFMARKRNIGEADAVKTWGFPIVPVFYLAASLFLMVVSYLNRPLEATVAIGTILIGIPIFHFWRKRAAPKV